MPRKVTAFFLLLALVFPAVPAAAQPSLDQPETIEEAKGLGLQFLREIPEAMRQVWENEGKPVFLSMGSWAEGMGNRFVFSWLRDLWEQLLGMFGKEIEERRPAVEQEFEREKQQLKEEIQEQLPGAKKTLWGHIKGLFDGNGQE